ncbi:pyruvate kinase 2, cytosolic-like [Tasmannia lanceolata]|uniref:pyruvate kinase 2, cytosolic-like n=1 Tax=Tasmannia lanceolata TaxID=3420 RepID=UPI00406339E9
MQGGQMVVEEPVRLVSVLTPTMPSFVPSLTKIVGTLGPKSRSVEVIEECLKAEMSVARFDFSWSNDDYHQETLDKLRIAVKNVKKLCAVMLDTVGPELQVCNTSGDPIELKADAQVTLTPDLSQEPSAEVLPINYAELAEGPDALARQRIEELKEEVSCMLSNSSDPFLEMNLIDTLELLGVAYHFETQIEEALSRIYIAYTNG